jgi:GntR family transcriptional regulator
MRQATDSGPASPSICRALVELYPSYRRRYRSSGTGNLAGVSELAAPGGDEELVYVRVAEDIADRIASGELASGTRLRAERDLAEHYGVSYGTVRHAMKVLRERGLIRTVHGRGTFVA